MICVVGQGQQNAPDTPAAGCLCCISVKAYRRGAPVAAQDLDLVQWEPGIGGQAQGLEYCFLGGEPATEIAVPVPACRGLLPLRWSKGRLAEGIVFLQKLWPQLTFHHKIRTNAQNHPITPSFPFNQLLSKPMSI